MQVSLSLHTLTVLLIFHNQFGKRAHMAIFPNPYFIIALFSLKDNHPLTPSPSPPLSHLKYNVTSSGIYLKFLQIRGEGASVKN